jgi:hypothetical protein
MPDRRELASLVRLKGSPHQSDYLHKINNHVRLRKAIWTFTDQVDQS